MALPIRYIWARHQRCEHLVDARIRTLITDSPATRTNRHTLGMDVICLTLAIPEMLGRREPVYILEDVILVPVFHVFHNVHHDNQALLVQRTMSSTE